MHMCAGRIIRTNVMCMYIPRRSRCDSVMRLIHGTIRPLLFCNTERLPLLCFFLDLWTPLVWFYITSSCFTCDCHELLNKAARPCLSSKSSAGEGKEWGAVLIRRSGEALEWMATASASVRGSSPTFGATSLPRDFSNRRKCCSLNSSHSFREQFFLCF